jgi:hypothetical protein
MLIEHMGKGYSFSSFGADIGTGRKTLYDWVRDIPEFAKAKEAGEERSKKFWETLLVSKGSGQKITTKNQILDPKNMDTTAIIFATKTRFRDTYAETVKVEIDDLKELTSNISKEQIERIAALARSIIDVDPKTDDDKL